MVIVQSAVWHPASSQGRGARRHGEADAEAPLLHQQEMERGRDRHRPQRGKEPPACTSCLLYHRYDKIRGCRKVAHGNVISLKHWSRVERKLDVLGQQYVSRTLSENTMRLTSLAAVTSTCPQCLRLARQWPFVFNARS